MSISCVVLGCTNANISNVKARFFKFPSSNHDFLRRQFWITAIISVSKNQKWKPSKHSRVCSAHFITGKPSKYQNHPDFVPSVFSYNQENASLVKRHIKCQNESPTKRTLSDTSQVQDPNFDDDIKEVYCDVKPKLLDLDSANLELQLATKKIHEIHQKIAGLEEKLSDLTGRYDQVVREKNHPNNAEYLTPEKEAGVEIALSSRLIDGTTSEKKGNSSKKTKNVRETTLLNLVESISNDSLPLPFLEDHTGLFDTSSTVRGTHPKRKLHKLSGNQCSRPKLIVKLGKFKLPRNKCSSKKSEIVKVTSSLSTVSSIPNVFLHLPSLNDQTGLSATSSHVPATQPFKKLYKGLKEKRSKPERKDRKQLPNISFPKKRREAQVTALLNTITSNVDNSLHLPSLTNKEGLSATLSSAPATEPVQRIHMSQPIVRLKKLKLRPKKYSEKKFLGACEAGLFNTVPSISSDSVISPSLEDQKNKLASSRSVPVNQPVQSLQILSGKQPTNPKSIVSLRKLKLPAKEYSPKKRRKVKVSALLNTVSSFPNDSVNLPSLNNQKDIATTSSNAPVSEPVPKLHIMPRRQPSIPEPVVSLTKLKLPTNENISKNRNYVQKNALFKTVQRISNESLPLTSLYDLQNFPATSCSVRLTQPVQKQPLLSGKQYDIPEPVVRLTKITLPPNEYYPKKRRKVWKTALLNTVPSIVDSSLHYPWFSDQRNLPTASSNVLVTQPVKRLHTFSGDQPGIPRPIIRLNKLKLSQNKCSPKKRSNSKTVITCSPTNFQETEQLSAVPSIISNDLNLPQISDQKDLSVTLNSAPNIEPVSVALDILPRKQFNMPGPVVRLKKLKLRPFSVLKM